MTVPDRSAVVLEQPGTDAGIDADASLSLEGRRSRIVGLLEEQARVTVAELARRFSVSEVTVRSDLRDLDRLGAVVRVHGGAMLRRDRDELPISVKQNLHRAEKARIAQEAATLIRNGQTVILDSGTTTAEIARQICRLPLQSLTVITNALNTALLVAAAPHVNLVVPGGVLHRQSWSLSGPQAENALRSLRADLLFLGVDSLDPEVGLMTPHLLEAQLNALMIQVSREVVAVTDSSKLLRRSLSVIAPVERVALLITDREADAACVQAIRARGVEVRLV